MIKEHHSCVSLTRLLEKNVDRIFCAGREQTKAGKQQVFHVRKLCGVANLLGEFFAWSQLKGEFGMLKRFHLNLFKRCMR